MRANGLDALSLIGQNNVGYATGARAPAADASLAAHQRMVTVVRADDEWPHLYTAFPDGGPPELPPDHLHEALPVETEAGAAALVSVLPARRVAFDDCTYALYRAAADLEPQDATPTMGAAKIVKTADEIELIRAAERINEEAMLDVEPLVVPGVRATELSGRFLRRVYELGATANTVDPIFQTMPASIVWSAAR
jgi:Xaa-Pro aminopeptidase